MTWSGVQYQLLVRLVTFHFLDDIWLSNVDHHSGKRYDASSNWQCSLKGTRPRNFRQFQGPVSPRSWKFSLPKSRSKISNLLTTELFYSYILNTNRGSLHTRSFRRIYLSVSKKRLTKNGFSGPKRFWGFRETGPSSYQLVIPTIYNCLELSTQNKNRKVKKRYGWAKFDMTETDCIWVSS